MFLKIRIFIKYFVRKYSSLHMVNGNISDIQFHWQIFTHIHHWRNMELVMHGSSPLLVAELKWEMSHLTHISCFQIPYK